MESKVSRRQFLRLAGGAAGAIALAACAAPTAPAGGGETAMSQEKIVIRYAGLDGMGARVETFMLPSVEENGYELERGAFGQQELTDKIMQSVATDIYLADIFQFPSNARADVIGANALLKIPDLVLEAIVEVDGLPGIVNTLSWEGKVYALPYDGDIHYYSFRKDLFADEDINSRFKDTCRYDLSPENGAETWDQWRNICEFFTGWHWNGNGEDDDFGAACMTKRGDTL